VAFSNGPAVRFFIVALRAELLQAHHQPTGT
jgi:hypothetical protein